MENKVIISLDEYLRMRDDFVDMSKKVQEYQYLLDQINEDAKTQSEARMENYLDPLCMETRSWIDIDYDDLKKLLNKVKGTKDLEIRVKRDI